MIAHLAVHQYSSSNTAVMVIALLESIGKFIAHKLINQTNFSDTQY